MKQLELIAIVASIVLLGGYVLYGLVRAHELLGRDKHVQPRKPRKKRRNGRNNQNDQSNQSSQNIQK